MNVIEVIRAMKFDVRVGEWHTGHVTRSAFPLSHARAKNYKFGPQYNWRVVRFETHGRQFRVLILLNEEKMIFRASLAVERDNDLAVLCTHEYHASEPGWHCHLTLAELDSVLSGVARRHLRRWPQADAATRLENKVSLTSALSITAARFRFEAKGDLL